MSDVLAVRTAPPKPKSRAGWLYAMRNEALPGVLKIGHTTGQPELRLRHYNRLAGAVDGLPPFEIAWGVKVTNSKRVGSLVHKALVGSRLRPDREFFRTTVDALCDAVDVLLRREVDRSPWAARIPTHTGGRKHKAINRIRVAVFFDWLVENRSRLVGVPTVEIIRLFYAENREYVGREISETYAFLEWERAKEAFNVEDPTP